MTQKNNNLAPIVEIREQAVQTHLQAQDILKTKQLVPQGFVELFRPERNNWGSTQGLPKPLCERYMFSQEVEWFTIDIPHTLMMQLQLSEGESCPFAVYIAPQVLERKPVCGGITIENANEVFLLKPFSTEKEIQTNLTSEEINELEKTNNSLRNQVQKLKVIEAEVWNQIGLLEEQVSNEKKERTQQLTTLQSKLTNLTAQIGQLTTERNNLQTNLTTSNKTNTNLNTQINTLLLRPTPEQLTKVQNHLNQLESDLRNKQRELVSSQTIERSLREGVRTLEEKLENEKKENQQKGQVIADLRNQITSLATEKDSLKSEINRERVWVEKYLNDNTKNKRLLLQRFEEKLEKYTSIPVNQFEVHSVNFSLDNSFCGIAPLLSSKVIESIDGEIGDRIFFKAFLETIREEYLIH